MPTDTRFDIAKRNMSAQSKQTSGAGHKQQRCSRQAKHLQARPRAARTWGCGHNNASVQLLTSWNCSKELLHGVLGQNSTSPLTSRGALGLPALRAPRGVWAQGNNRSLPDCNMRAAPRRASMRRPTVCARNKKETVVIMASRSSFLAEFQKLRLASGHLTEGRLIAG